MHLAPHQTMRGLQQTQQVEAHDGRGVESWPLGQGARPRREGLSF